MSTASVNLPKAIDGFVRRILAFGRLCDLLSKHSDRRYTSVGDYVGSLSLALAAAILEQGEFAAKQRSGTVFSSRSAASAWVMSSLNS
jgi:hypothetical protein